MTTTTTTIDAGGEASLVRTLHIIYALHALGLALGAFGAASVVGSFLFGWPSIIAVIVSYIYRGDARGSWLESHFAWAIRTFWFALLFAAVVALVSAPLVLLLGLGSLDLADGRVVHGFLCEAHALSTARDISQFGGWRAYLSAN